MDIRKDFGRRVKTLRTRSGVSQECLAERSGLDRTYISSMERGGRNVSLLNIERIAAALHVTVEYLFSNECLTSPPDYGKKEVESAF
ncbi:helix-turn-helix domain-containing protein [Paenibacillus mesotrionivorans]|uniref:Helix-turn-helix domain-containing protein n=1 Tax=Paenibacillus mesotrionivorans TaxID=3160968 RepID=A0ACC7P1K8_9BACL